MCSLSSFGLILMRRPPVCRYLQDIYTVRFVRYAVTGLITTIKIHDTHFGKFNRNATPQHFLLRSWSIPYVDVSNVHEFTVHITDETWTYLKVPTKVIDFLFLLLRLRRGGTCTPDEENPYFTFMFCIFLRSFSAAIAHTHRR
jgi:hypothetical protein